MKKRWSYSYLVLLFIIMVSASVLAETAYFYWYNAAGTQCKTTTAGSLPDGTTTHADSAPTSKYECCNVEGTALVNYCTDFGTCYGQIGTYNVDWDNDQTDCVCYQKTWGLAGNYVSKWCCGDDANEYVKSRTCASWCSTSASDKACCIANTQCVYGNTCYINGGCYGKVANCANGAWWDSDSGELYCTVCAGSGLWNLGAGELAATTCCGDDPGEYKVTQGVGTQACCNNANDCVDRNNRCRDEWGEENTCDPSDGIDDDCDGKTDCSDTDCTLEPECMGCSPEICNNGKDDDCDHYVDCEDNDCIDECGSCNTEICNNGIDDDCDGKIDCKDSDCTNNPVACPGCVDEICTNGVDDDCDGLVDNADWDCAGCPVGETLCKDIGKCCADCEGCDTANKGCIAEDGECKEGEGCACSDCIGKRDSCGVSFICDAFYQTCKCPAGTQLCPNGYCRETCGICGNGILEQGEECDGSEFPPGITSCINLGLQGIIGCTDCLITGCTDGPKNCGDGLVQTGETCDGLNLSEQTCASFDFDSGFLSCFSPGTENECHFDTSGCYNEGCIDKNGVCESGEGCQCPDCLDKQSTCGYGQVCDETASCACKDGTTLCGDGTCRPPTECPSMPSCNNNGICESGEGCSCPEGEAGCIDGICTDCEGKTDNCKYSSMCMDGFCTSCSITKAYWSEDCIGSGKEVSMIVEGTQGCEGKTVSLQLNEQDSGGEKLFIPIGDEYNLESTQVAFVNKKAEFKWTSKWYNEGTGPNDCAVFCDAGKYYKSPPKKFLEYYFLAEIGTEKIYSEVLKVHYCIPECDADCDTYVDNDLEETQACQNALNSDPDYGWHEGTFKIDAAPESGYCEDCTPEGLSPGQKTCSAYFDCTPNWWTRKGVPYTGAGSESEASSNLEWGECGEYKSTVRYPAEYITDRVRQRLICPPDKPKEDCCKDPASCYCQVPSQEIMEKYNCDDPNFRPPEIKACLAEEKFPFFTNMNLIITVLILIGFYIWKIEKRKVKNRNIKKH